MNVTQISNTLQKSKSTVSRHLRALKKDGFLYSKEKPSNRPINPKFYSLTEEFDLNLIESRKEKSLEQQIDETLKKKNMAYFMEKLEKINITIKIVKKSLDLINPFMKRVAKQKIKDLEQLKKIYGEYILGRKLSLRTFLIKESDLAEFNRIYDNFKQKIEKFRIDKGMDDFEDEKKLLFIDSMLPLSDFLIRDD